MSTDTPEPAEVDLEQWEDLNVTNGGDLYVHRVTDDSGNEIARIDGGLEAWPLARAMAAAPELLAALRTTCDQLDALTKIYLFTDGDDASNSIVLEKARAALAKAEGKA